MARAIFGDPNRVQLKVVTANERQSMLEEGQVDMVIRALNPNGLHAAPRVLSLDVPTMR